VEFLEEATTKPLQGVEMNLLNQAAGDAQNVANLAKIHVLEIRHSEHVPLAFRKTVQVFPHQVPLVFEDHLGDLWVSECRLGDLIVRARVREGLRYA
jgi:hypothetical protein